MLPPLCYSTELTAKMLSIEKYSQAELTVLLTVLGRDVRMLRVHCDTNGIAEKARQIF